jgi:hypothetical protein
MKKLLLLLIACVFAKYSHAQYGISIGYLKPSSSFGYLFKPAPSIGLVFQESDIDDRFHFTVSANYANFKARRDTFFSYGMQYGGSGTKYLPAYEVWQKFSFLSLNALGDLLILDRDFTPFVGLGIHGGLSFYELNSELSTVISSSEVSGDGYIGYSLNTGVLYRIDDTFQFKIRAGRVRSIGIESAAKIPYYMFNFEFLIDVENL